MSNIYLIFYFFLHNNGLEFIHSSERDSFKCDLNRLTIVMDQSEIDEIWKDFLDPCVTNPGDGFESVNLTFVGTGDQKCEEFFNYNKYVQYFSC